MKTFEELYKEEWENRDWDEHGSDAYKRAAKRYATQVGRDALNRAAENARSCVVGSLSSAMREDMEKFITNTQIILP